MRGFTRKRGKTWTAYYDVYDKDGNRKQRSKGGFARQKDAEAHLATTVTAVAAGTFVEPSKQPFARFLRDEWLPAIRSTVRPLTFTNYSRTIERYVERRDIGAIPLRLLSGAHLNALYSELEREGLSPGTRRLAHAVLGRALKDAVRWRRIARSPALDADPPARPRPSASAWSPRELRRFLAHVEHDRLAALWRLAAATGMRRGELLGLSWRTVELDNARLTVDRQLVPTDGGHTYGPPKSVHSERTIALDPTTVGTLRQHRNSQALERAIAGNAYKDEDLVFCDELGRPLRPQWLTARFRSLRRSAGLSTGTPHTLRHTVATLALTATPPVPLHILAGRLGDDPTTVLRTYAHLLPRSDVEAANVLGGILDDKPMTQRAVEAA